MVANNMYEDVSLGALHAWAQQHEKRDDDRFQSLSESLESLTQSIRNGTIILVCGMAGIIGFFVVRDILTRPATAASAVIAAAPTLPTISLPTPLPLMYTHRK